MTSCSPPRADRPWRIWRDSTICRCNRPRRRSRPCCRPFSMGLKRQVTEPTQAPNLFAMMGGTVAAGLRQPLRRLHPAGDAAGQRRPRRPVRDQGGEPRGRRPGGGAVGDRRRGAEGDAAGGGDHPDGRHRQDGAAAAPAAGHLEPDDERLDVGTGSLPQRRSSPRSSPTRTAAGFSARCSARCFSRTPSRRPRPRPLGDAEARPDAPTPPPSPT